MYYPWMWALVIALAWPGLFFLIDSPEININYLGHSCFLVNFDNRVMLLTDYGEPDAWEEYGWSSPIGSIGSIIPDITTYSHLHADHYDSTRLENDRIIIVNRDTSFRFKGLKVTSIRTSEKDTAIKDNITYLFSYRGVKILHMGDCQADIISLGEQISGDSFIEQLPKRCDIMLFPIEGTSEFAKEAFNFVRQTKAWVYIPMHYWSREYRDNFLDIAGSFNGAGESDYRILRCANSSYLYKRSFFSNEVKIVGLERGGY